MRLTRPQQWLPAAAYPALLAAVLILCAGCAGSTDTNNPAGAAAGKVSVVKSPNDPRDYRYVTLPNQLRMLLVSDPTTDKAAASLVALRGSFHEPEEFPGLAHFLEHMLFIGTKKYPEVDAYQTFINAHGGSSNAYTALDHTNYFFDIQPEYFREAMDRFAQFFIAPALDPAYVDREKNAVHSEYQLQTKNDGWRANLTQKLTLNPEHPGARFTIGSLETLGDGVLPALKTFFNENYSADQMILVVFGAEDVDTLEQWVTPMFGAIADRNLGPAATLPGAFTENGLPATLKLKALKDKNQLNFTFPVPSEIAHYRQKPLLYISNLLGHEGKGSLHARLKEFGWIENLGASSSEFDAATSFINVSITLSESGIANIPAVTDQLFAYVEMLRSQAPAQWLFEEQAKVLDLAFRFQEQGSATGFVYRTAPQLAHYPPQEILRAAYRMDKFDPALITSYLNAMTPDNVLVEISGPDVEGDQVEPWFNVSYSLKPGVVARQRPTPEALAAAAGAPLALPPPNPFLPERVDLLDNQSEGPRVVVEAPGLEIWHDQDTSFRIPRANQLLTLGIERGIGTPQEIAMAQLYAALVNDALNDYAYPAYLAGLGYQFAASSTGFEIQLNGYDDKQLLLLKRMLQTFNELKINPQRFALSQRQLASNWSSARTDHPYRQTSSAIDQLLVSSSWSPALLADVVAKVTPKELTQWRDQRLQKFSVQGLLHGNLNRKRVTELQKILQEALPLKAFNLVRPAVADSQAAKRLPLSIDHDDAAMVLYVQDPDSSIDSRANSALAVHLLRQPFFTSLRTNQQLGYVVGVSNKPLRNRSSVTFIIQSPVADPVALQQATYDFVEEFVGNIGDMPNAEFLEYRAGLIADLTEQDKNLSQRTSRYWGDLRLGFETFDRRQQLATRIEQITQAQAVGYLQALQKRLAKQRLIAYSKGKFSAEPTEGTRIDSPQQHKQSLFNSGG